MNHVQRGRMDDQRCSLDPSKSAPCTPKQTRKPAENIGSSGDNVFTASLNSLRSVLLSLTAHLFKKDK